MRRSNRDPELRLKLAEEYGEEANYMVIEALVQSGVVLTPLAKYRDFNIRICRPFRLSESDLRIVMDEALAHVGREYDCQERARPRSLLPAGKPGAGALRRTALRFGSGDPTRAICSSMIAECFDRVRFPIVPKIEPLPEGYPTVHDPPRRFGKLISRPARPSPGLYHMISPSLVTPRDFDLSPYFEGDQVQPDRRRALRLSQDRLGRRRDRGSLKAEGRLTGLVRCAPGLR